MPLQCIPQISEYGHNISAHGFTCSASTNKVTDETRPMSGPLLLHNLQTPHTHAHTHTHTHTHHTHTHTHTHNTHTRTRSTHTHAAHTGRERQAQYGHVPTHCPYLSTGDHTNPYPIKYQYCQKPCHLSSSAHCPTSFNRSSGFVRCVLT